MSTIATSPDQSIPKWIFWFGIIVMIGARFITEAGDLLDGILYGQMGASGIAGHTAAMIFLAFLSYTIALRQLWPIAR